METHVPITRKVITIGPESGIDAARALMLEHRIRHLPVVDPDGRLLGILSDRDIRSATPFRFEKGFEVEKQGLKDTVLQVADVMTHRPRTLSTHYTLQDVLTCFQQTKVGAFPVVDEHQRVVGIISDRDLLQSFIHLIGASRPGVFAGVRLANKAREIGRLLDAVCQGGILIGSMLTIEEGDSGYATAFLYLQTKNTHRAHIILEEMGYELVNPMDWFLGRFDWQRTGSHG